MTSPQDDNLLSQIREAFKPFSDKPGFNLATILKLLRRNPNSEELVGVKFNCLNHGFVQLVDYLGSDETVEKAARVSYVGGSNEVRTAEQRRNLIRYLLRNKHTTPFEMVEFVFHVKVPMFVWRQWIRHRTANVNEISGRYQELPDEFYIPEENVICVQSTSSKQGRGEPLSEKDAQDEIFTFTEEGHHAFAAYKHRLDKGMAKELSRINLPLSTYTEAIFKLDLHNLMHFLALRLHSHAQHEIRVYAEAIADVVCKACPISWQAFEDYRLNAIQLSAMERLVLGQILKSGIAAMEQAQEAGKPTALEIDFDRVGMSSREVGEFINKLKGMGISADLFGEPS